MFLRAVCLFMLSVGMGTWSQGQVPRTSAGFTVRDDIALNQFGDPYYYVPDDLLQSPSGDYVVAHTVSNDLSKNAIVDTLYIYRFKSIEHYLLDRGANDLLLPLWVIRKSSSTSFADGPLITTLRWTRDGRGLAFLYREALHQHRLILADLSSRQVIDLTPRDKDIRSFSIVDRTHFVYTLPEPNVQSAHKTDSGYRVATGVSLSSLLNPSGNVGNVQRSSLWSVDGGKSRKLTFPRSHKPIILYGDGVSDLALSPDHSQIVTILPVPELSAEWQKRYLPPYPESQVRVIAGKQDLEAPNQFYVGEYVVINIGSGKLVSLTGGPASVRAGWWESLATATWSKDSSSVVLPGTFLESAPPGSPPCVAIVQIRDLKSDCLQPLKRNLGTGYEAGYKRIVSVRFDDDKDNVVSVQHYPHDDGSVDETRYTRKAIGGWARSETIGAAPRVKLEIKADLTHPPLLIATDSLTHTGRTVLDPNPQLRGVAFGTPEPYTWKDETGRAWEGILYKPLGYQAGKRYPLVIQNHGFSTTRFTPSGGFPSAFVAQELASVGIMVLHVRDCAGRGTSDEGPCNVKGYESAISTLDKDGLIDRNNVGLIGFSRTVYYVLQALTTSKVHFRAASITDGINLGYFNYIAEVGGRTSGMETAEHIIGAPPYAQGLSSWLARSPEFNLDRVATPLRVVATRYFLQMWEPYAVLQRMGKPVDFIILDTDEHVFTEPRIRFAAQEGNVDWFRFWLQGYEDPAQSKRDQYQRWHVLRHLEPTEAQ